MKKLYIIIFSAIFFVAVLKSCGSENTELNSVPCNGSIVGYTKCNDNNGNLLTGFFIITERKDYFLSFNLPPSLIEIDTNLSKSGAYNIKGGNIRFDYSIAVGDEIEQNFLCAQNAMDLGFFYDVDKFVQIIIKDIISYTP